MGSAPKLSAQPKNVSFSPGLQEEFKGQACFRCTHPLRQRQNCLQCQCKFIKSGELRISHLLKMEAILQSKSDTDHFHRRKLRGSFQRRPIG